MTVSRDKLDNILVISLLAPQVILDYLPPPLRFTRQKHLIALNKTV